MEEKRYKELQLGESDKLTKQEIEQGWFFCCELDYEIVNKNWEHIKSICTCNK